MTSRAPKAKAKLINNIVWDGGSGQKNQQICRVGKGEKAGRVDGSFNWLSAGFKIIDGGSLDSTYQAKGGENPPFVESRQGRLPPQDGRADDRGRGPAVAESSPPDDPRGRTANVPATGRAQARTAAQYVSPLNTRERPGFTADAKADLGAFGWESPEKRN